jgi:hypothetical protein
MTSHYARNIQWSALLPDNTVEATFDIYNDEEALVASGVKATGPISEIQQILVNTLKAKTEAVGLYEAITENTELEVEMAA